MKIDTSESWLPVYEAMASKVRLNIIRLLSRKSMNIKELAGELKLSSAIVTMHVSKLERAGIITSVRSAANGAIQKMCSLAVDSLEVEFPSKIYEEKKFHQFIIPIGHYTDFSVTPTCGLATQDKIIGYFDDPRYFLDAERVNAKILWFTQGFVEYKIPNHLLTGQQPYELEISMELGSEAPGTNSNWPSDISFTINGIRLGQWTSPGDFGGTRGKYTPPWWNIAVNQFGLLKVLRINRAGAWMDGEKLSDVGIDRLELGRKQWSLRISVEEDAANAGGLTIYGKGFGNYDQDILLRLYYA